MEHYNYILEIYTVHTKNEFTMDLSISVEIPAILESPRETPSENLIKPQLKRKVVSMVLTDRFVNTLVIDSNSCM